MLDPLLRPPIHKKFITKRRFYIKIIEYIVVPTLMYVYGDLNS